jgi:hypothetical protein
MHRLSGFRLTLTAYAITYRLLTLATDGAHTPAFGLRLVCRQAAKLARCGSASSGA